MLGTILVVMSIGYIASRLIYWLVIDREVPGGWDRRFGTNEPLPADVGQWSTDDASAEGQEAKRAGMRREVRLFYDPHRWRSKLVRQVRYRSLATHAIVRAERDTPVARRRIRPW